MAYSALTPMLLSAATSGKINNIFTDIWIASDIIPGLRGIWPAMADFRRHWKHLGVKDGSETKIQIEITAVELGLLILSSYLYVNIGTCW